MLKIVWHKAFAQNICSKAIRSDAQSSDAESYDDRYCVGGWCIRGRRDVCVWHWHHGVYLPERSLAVASTRCIFWRNDRRAPQWQVHHWDVDPARLSCSWVHSNDLLFFVTSQEGANQTSP